MITSKLTVLFIVAAVSCVHCDSLTAKHFYISKDNRRWNEARKACEDIGGRLAQIDNQQTLDALIVYAKTSHWKDHMTSHFWIGLNRDDQSQNYRWDHCESVDASSFTFWGDPTLDHAKLCVYAEQDTLRWFSEVCDSSSYKYLCQKDTGPCTYSSVTCSGSSHGETSEVAGVDVAGCEDLCSNTLQDEEACWMYSYDSPNCTLYYDDNPWACTTPPLATVVKRRVCFTFETLTSHSSFTSSENKPIINCDLYTTQAASEPTTTTVATTTTVTPVMETSSADNTSTGDNISPNVTTSSENAPISRNTEAAISPGPTHTSDSDVITTPTTTTMGTTMSEPRIPTTEHLTMTTNPTTPSTGGTTTARRPATPAGASITMATDPTPPPTAHIAMTTNLTTSITMTTDSPSPASVRNTMGKTYPATKLTGTQQLTTAETQLSTAAGTAPSTTQTVTTTPTSQPTTVSTTAMTPLVGSSSGNKYTCPCLVCVESKTVIERQHLVDAILLLLKLDKSKLSATRRRLKSEPDDRPSAQAIGYSGILFIVITFSFFVLSDLMRLRQHGSAKHTQIQTREKTV